MATGRDSVPYRLYHYWRSSSSWRVRWALHHKGIPHDLVPVQLVQGEQKSPAHLLRNPIGLVPTLEFVQENDPARRFLSDSLAIIEYLEERHPEHPLLPNNPRDRGTVRHLAQIISSSIQPLQNFEVLRAYSPNEGERMLWAQRWIHRGFGAYETLLNQTSGSFSFGGSITMADLCLIPQCYNALRNEVRLEDYPHIFRIWNHCQSLEGYQQSEPEVTRPR